MWIFEIESFKLPIIVSINDPSHDLFFTYNQSNQKVKLSVSSNNSIPKYPNKMNNQEETKEDDFYSKIVFQRFVFTALLPII